METPRPIQRDAWITWGQQFAQDLITGIRFVAGREYGEILLRVLAGLEEQVDERDRLDARVDALDARVDALAADVEETQALCDQQRETIAALLVENEDLRAKLYLQDRQVVPRS
jgi:hypothetical protein